MHLSQQHPDLSPQNKARCVISSAPHLPSLGWSDAAQHLCAFGCWAGSQDIRNSPDLSFPQMLHYRTGTASLLTIFSLKSGQMFIISPFHPEIIRHALQNITIAKIL